MILDHPLSMMHVDAFRRHMLETRQCILDNTRRILRGAYPMWIQRDTPFALYQEDVPSFWEYGDYGEESDPRPETFFQGILSVFMKDTSDNALLNACREEEASFVYLEAYHLCDEGWELRGGRNF